MGFEDYEITSEWTISANGKYAFCEKRDKKYFIKELPSPTDPDEKILPPDSYRRIKDNFDEIFKQKKELMERLKRASAESRSIVAPVDMFVHNKHICLVSEMVTEEMIPPSEIPRRTKEEKKGLLLDFAKALESLENQGVVHGDLKHSNVFIVDTGSGLEVRIIDFDDSYLERSPPSPEGVIGSPEYYSPELGTYISSEDPSRDTITTKSDVFAAGILFHEYVTGSRPTHGTCKYPFQAIRDDQIVMGPHIDEFGPMIKKMLLLDPLVRLSANDVRRILSGERIDDTHRGTGRIVVIVHRTDGKYCCIDESGRSQCLPEFAAKGMSKTYDIPIEEEGEGPHRLDIPPTHEDESIERPKRWSLRRRS